MSAISDRLDIDDLTQLAAPELRGRLATLIRQYAHQRSVELAETILCHIEALCLHPADCRDAEQLCAYRRLARHWRWLAASQRAPLTSSFA